MHELSTPSDRIIIDKLSKLSAHCSANAPEFLAISIRIQLLLFLSTITVVRVGSLVNVLQSVGHVKF